MTGPYRTFDPADAQDRETYFQLTSIVVPRPIAWISTLAADGTANIAPFSFTTVLSSEPPIVCFISSGIKDSLVNAQAQGDFVYNIGGEEMLEKLNQTAADLHRDESEFEWVDLTPIPSDLITSPRLGEAAASLECRLLSVTPFGDKSYMVAGEVIRMHVAERLFTDDRIDPTKLKPICRLSGSNYATLGEVITIKRPNRQDLIDLGLQPGL
jgi:flavin reductase (DIM6/NTAB) family NADH-FMN oxidoreductase RutF